MLPVTGLAIVLLVIFILIVVAIFNPISYAVELVTRKPYKFRFYIQWWGKMFRIHFVYEQGKPFFKEVYILRKAKLGAVRDYEDWLARRVAEETEDPDESKVYEEELEPYRTPVEEQTTETVKVVKQVRFDAEGNPIERIEETMEKPIESTFGSGVENLSKTETETANEDVVATEDTTTEEATEAKIKKEEDPHKRWWLKHVLNGALYEKLLLVTKRCYNHSKPRYCHIEGQFGTGDPYKMGLTAAALYSIWPEKMAHVELSYVEPICKGSFEIRGHISPGVLAWYGTLFAVSQPVRALLIDAVKAGWRYRKAQKAKKQAEANTDDNDKAMAA